MGGYLAIWCDLGDGSPPTVRFWQSRGGPHAQFDNWLIHRRVGTGLRVAEVQVPFADRYEWVVRAEGTSEEPPTMWVRYKSGTNGGPSLRDEALLGVARCDFCGVGWTDGIAEDDLIDDVDGIFTGIEPTLVTYRVPGVDVEFAEVLCVVHQPQGLEANGYSEYFCDRCGSFLGFTSGTHVSRARHADDHESGGWARGIPPLFGELINVKLCPQCDEIARHMPLYEPPVE
jgi:hypothetical protein